VLCVDTSADICADTGSIIKRLQTFFKAHVEVEKTGPSTATLTIDGLDGATETVDVSL